MDLKVSWVFILLAYFILFTLSVLDEGQSTSTNT